MVDNQSIEEQLIFYKKKFNEITEEFETFKKNIKNNQTTEITEATEINEIISSKKYYLRNREKTLISNRKSMAKIPPEKRAEYNRNYQSKITPDKRAEYNKKAYLKRKEKIKKLELESNLKTNDNQNFKNIK